MNGDEKKSGGRASQKRGIIIAFAAMAAVVLIWYVAVPAVGSLIEYINSQGNGDKITSDYMDHVVSHRFAAADYNEDIYADEEYMQKDHSIAYKNGPDTYYITDGDFSSYGATVKFFGRYFDTVINGRYKEYDAYFTDFYFENQKNKERFTPQKLYDIKIELIGSTTDNDVTTYNYYVEFKIVKNNGTFRNDIGSNSSRRIIYELCEYSDGTVLINYIGAGLRKQK